MLFQALNEFDFAVGGERAQLGQKMCHAKCTGLGFL